MRLAELFGRTWREAPANAVMVSHQLAVRGGLAEPVAPGAWALLPLGQRVMDRLQVVLREAFEVLGGQMIRLPVPLPDGLAEPEATYRPAVLKLAARAIDSYKDLPQVVFHFSPQGVAGSRGSGLFGLNTNTVGEVYAFHAEVEGGQRWAAQVEASLLHFFAQLDVPVVVAENDESGRDRVLVLRHAQGDETLARCDRCGYAALAGAARFEVADGPCGGREPVQRVATPDCKTIQEVAAYLGVPEAQTLKAVFFVQERAGEADRFVFAVVRGDLAIDEGRLRQALGGGSLRPATDDEIRANGAVPGYASPIGLPPEVLVVADRSVLGGVNFVAGANEDGYHLTGVNVPRDFTPDVTGAMAATFDGAVCGSCHDGALHLEPAFVLGRILAPEPAPAVSFSDERGAEQGAVLSMASVWLERVLAAVIETHHDDWGIVWPPVVAPFDVHIVTLGRDPAFTAQAVELSAALEVAGLSVLLDDRPESAGVKFTDADLIGVPVRLTVSKKAVAAGGFEGKRRDSRERVIVPRAEVVDWVRSQRTTGGE